MTIKNKEYVLDLSEDAKTYIRFSTTDGFVDGFVVKLLFRCGNEWHEVLRYDSGHDCPHKDILDTDGNIVRKVWYDFLDNGQALTMAITDIKDNFEFYKERFEKWLRKQ